MFNVPTVLLERRVLTGTSASETFSDIAAKVATVDAVNSVTSRHLVMRLQLQATSGNPNVFFRFNGDSGANYNVQQMSGYSSTFAASRGSATTSVALIGNIDDLANAYTSSFCLFTDAFSTRSQLACLSLTGRLEEVFRASAGRWENTAAVTSIEVLVDSSTMTAGSVIEIAVVDETYNVGEDILTGSSTLNIGSLSADLGDLSIIANMRGAHTGEDEYYLMELNGDTTDSNYVSQYINASGTGMDSGQGNTRRAGGGLANGAGAGKFGAFVAQVSNFSDGSNDRIYTTLSGGHSDSTTSLLRQYVTRRDNTAAVTQVTIKGGSVANLVADSMISVYSNVPKNLIERVELGADANTITFSSIPDTYDHLEVSAYVQTGDAGTTAEVRLVINGDTTAANYETQRFRAVDTTISALKQAYNPALMGAGIGGSANQFSSNTMFFPEYKATDRHKHFLSTGGAAPDSTARFTNRTSRWKNTAAITSILFMAGGGTNDLKAGTVIELRGISSTIVSASDIAKVNTIALADIQAMNGITVANAEKINGITF